MCPSYQWQRTVIFLKLLGSWWTCGSIFPFIWSAWRRKQLLAFKWNFSLRIQKKFSKIQKIWKKKNPKQKENNLVCRYWRDNKTGRITELRFGSWKYKRVSPVLGTAFPWKKLIKFRKVEKRLEDWEDVQNFPQVYRGNNKSCLELEEEGP